MYMCLYGHMNAVGATSTESPGSEVIGSWEPSNIGAWNRTRGLWKSSILFRVYCGVICLVFDFFLIFSSFILLRQSLM